MRTAYKCRAYPTPEQAAVLNRTFGCVRLVWNKTLAAKTSPSRTWSRTGAWPRPSPTPAGPSSARCCNTRRPAPAAPWSS
ncbi:helix-turn-helix domain-containing protein, partial [Actinoplanes sp. NPDC049802]|uniref:helix-turn-helix domain-containing protein n=1 Tax=Actinoplanes sp. NPDC049802 TaxID=3154742 RepID=UPI0033F5D06A